MPAYMDKRILYDKHNSPVCSISGKEFAIQETVYISKGSDPSPQDFLCAVKRVLLSFTHSMEVFFSNNKTSTPDIVISSSFFRHAFKISTHSGVLLANITRDAFSAKRILTERDTYNVKIMQGVDMAIITCLVAVVDDVVINTREDCV
eukprot:TRINITY_DN3953_c0_g1_i1.p1 TRINITY_DN3953_c0_g1~~TRINITY_DN3953_c0_g1_i1.p1  ORF type:complete len:148 (+),score=16.24 TRINITY_DN3953_c0_g1_i1:139-582(+)